MLFCRARLLLFLFCSILVPLEYLLHAIIAMPCTLRERSGIDDIAVSFFCNNVDFSSRYRPRAVFADFPGLFSIAKRPAIFACDKPPAVRYSLSVYARKSRSFHLRNSCFHSSAGRYHCQKYWRYLSCRRHSTFAISRRSHTYSANQFPSGIAISI